MKFKEWFSLLFFSMIFTFCVKILMNNQQFEKCFFVRMIHAEKTHPVCKCGLWQENRYSVSNTSSVWPCILLSLSSHLIHGLAGRRSLWLASPGEAAARGRPRASWPGARCSWWRNQTAAKWVYSLTLRRHSQEASTELFQCDMCVFTAISNNLTC